jgi:hypothetical protein
LRSSILREYNDILDYSHVPTFGIRLRITEEFDKGGGEEGVGEFERVAAGAAQPVSWINCPVIRRCADKSGNSTSYSHKRSGSNRGRFAPDTLLLAHFTKRCDSSTA